MNQNVKNIVTYIDKQLTQVNAFNATNNLKGCEAKEAKAKKNGYMEALKNVRKVISDNIALR